MITEVKSLFGQFLDQVDINESQKNKKNIWLGGEPYRAEFVRVSKKSTTSLKELD